MLYCYRYIQKKKKKMNRKKKKKEELAAVKIEPHLKVGTLYPSCAELVTNIKY